MARSVKHRNLLPAIAIVGEGIVEKIYFTQLKQTEKLNFTVKPDLPKISSIQSIVAKGLELLKKEYDQVFCVFDLDEISRNPVIGEQYKALKRKYSYRKMVFIENNPSMEFWFLLHFVFTNRQFDSPDQLMNVLKKYIDDYEKSEHYLTRKKIYALLKPNQQAARSYAAKTNTAEHHHSWSEIHKILNFLKVT